MAIRLVNKVAASSATGTSVTTAAIDTTGATLLVVVVASDQANGTATASDSKGNTWTALTAQSVSGQSRCQMFYVANPTVGSGHTFTASGTGSCFPAIAALAFTGVTTSSPFDVQSGASTASSTGTLAAGSITPTQDNEVVVVGYSNSSGVTEGAYLSSPGAVTDQLILVSTKAYAVGAGFAIQGTAAAINATWSWNALTGSGGAAAVVASFKAAASGGTGGGAWAFCG